ncbi:Signal peptidase complex subunit [Friedmanniomyces endolithicus]|uniref:Signal peptidase subunit 3 n=1 Tax=Friedmanniomyces endolithicus TaxID=329885 RepID=A0A4U0UZ51_9PEZI|nr:Signal peptidase complex subunit [Friedmanniomyces endolithicus]KAK0291953.1 Signal peptidase complex subunit [Friedmanniomyces endolithicus]KAK0297867.1 Signal peptidase complex subunit [Friedmanniomyces endolithicus]KAK0305698.1 Signal peptidase complex subunit [Friedmanniomyces endolithicus]KAK0309957.1 Signal peptidase complex subunit [Friedmanniomyces endolithicus]
MHNNLTRIQNVFGFFTSVAFSVAAVIAVSVVLIPQTPSASLQLRNVQVVKGRPHYYSTQREEYAHVKFDLDADLSTLFNWNTKQIFAYITASYPSSDPSTIPRSEAIIWDAVIPAANAPAHPNTYIHPSLSKSNARPKTKADRLAAQKPYPPGKEPGILKLASQKPKYQINDVSGRIAERANATLTLHWNVQPWVGALVWDSRKTYGRWQGLRGGMAGFDFPALKGTEVKKEELRTETGGERNRGSPA